MDKMKIPVILGPTGVGKSSLAISLAKKIGGEIISCDSRQIYRDMSIGTAKSTKEELDAVPHHLIDILDPSDEYAAGMWSGDAKVAIDSIIKRGKTPIICGGSFFYYHALINGFDLETPPDRDFREECKKREEENPGVLYRELEEVDSKRALEIESADIYRVIRSLQRVRDNSLEKVRVELPYSFVTTVLERNRAELYDKINSRVDKMVEDGLYDEFESLLQKGYHKESPGLKCVGYQEFFNYIEGESSLSSCVETIKRSSRKYAKRQLTWLRNKIAATVTINLDESFEVADQVSTIIKYL